MNWLKDHVYVAAWVSPLIALIGMIISNSVTARPPDWSRLMIYVGFLTAIAVVFTPIVDDSARIFAGVFLVPLTAFIIWDAATNGGTSK
jgi:hypothetical protein